MDVAPLPTGQAKSPPIPRPMGHASCFTAPDISSIAQPPRLSNCAAQSAEKIMAELFLRSNLRVLRQLAAEIRHLAAETPRLNAELRRKALPIRE
ncbi:MULTISPECIES: hypothetical protein [Sphingobium]|uniref:hypothetical protein n=1 Tax=Sphingobium TaxID=165695 RepID=UPI000B1F78BC|nr:MULTISPECIES: hypothetical protein [Sphingobium]MCB4859019.1 hypothetical protein [Sphingobium sp. PNB]MEC6701542.1 hypothetical protein [Sphingobium sp. SJ10-10]NML91610.1 hypothetical protein [Sphingobium sp. TB-6]